MEKVYLIINDELADSVLSQFEFAAKTAGMSVFNPRTIYGHLFESNKDEDVIEVGIKASLEYMTTYCSEAWVVGVISPLMKREIEAARSAGIKVVYKRLGGCNFCDEEFEFVSRIGEQSAVIRLTDNSIRVSVLGVEDIDENKDFVFDINYCPICGHKIPTASEAEGECQMCGLNGSSIRYNDPSNTKREVSLSVGNLSKEKGPGIYLVFLNLFDNFENAAIYLPVPFCPFCGESLDK